MSNIRNTNVVDLFEQGANIQRSQRDSRYLVWRDKERLGGFEEEWQALQCMDEAIDDYHASLSFEMHLFCVEDTHETGKYRILATQIATPMLEQRDVEARMQAKGLVAKLTTRKA